MCGQQQRVVAVLNTVARLRLRHLRSHSLRSGCSSFTTPVRRSSQPLKPCCWLSTSTGPLAEGGVSATETVQAQAHARLLAEEELTDEEAEATRQSMASNQDWLLGELDSINPHDAPLPSPKTDGCGGEEVPKKSKGVDRGQMYRQMHSAYSKLSREGRGGKKLSPGLMQRVANYRKTKGASSSGTSS